MTSDDSPADLLLIGRVARAHGNRGQVIVNPETDFPDERFRVGQVVLVGSSARPVARRITAARFHPAGLPGLLYWYLLLPAHNRIFAGMPKAIREAAEAKVIGRQGHLGRLKAANPGMRAVMT